MAKSKPRLFVIGVITSKGKTPLHFRDLVSFEYDDYSRRLRCTDVYGVTFGYSLKNDETVFVNFVDFVESEGK